MPIELIHSFDLRHHPGDQQTQSKLYLIYWRGPIRLPGWTPRHILHEYISLESSYAEFPPAMPKLISG